MGCCVASTGQIVFLVGSLRKQSLQRSLLNYIMKNKILASGEIKIIVPDLSQLPFFSQEYRSYQKKLPKQSKSLIQSVSRAKAIVFITPEYNGAVSPSILNAFQWLTLNQEETMNPLKGKKCGILSASYISQGQISDIQIMCKDHLQIYEHNFYVDLKKGSMDQNGVLTNHKVQQDLDEWIKKFLRFSL